MRMVQGPKEELLPTIAMLNLAGKVFLYPTWFPLAIVKPTASHLHVFSSVEARGTQDTSVLD